MTDKVAYAKITGVSQSLLTPAEAAERLRVDPRTIRRWVAEGKLQGVTLPSGRIRIAAESIDELVSGDAA